MITKTKAFFKDVLKEMRLVSWPNKHDIKEGTAVVIVMSAIVGIFLSMIDYIFNMATRFLY